VSWQRPVAGAGEVDVEHAASGGQAEGAQDAAKDWEDVKSYTLDESDEEELLRRQTECTLIWASLSGHPMGVVVNFIHRRGHFGLTATEVRPRIKALRADPRVSIAISSKGSGIAVSRSLTYKGTCVLHDDDETKAWFFPEFAAALRPGQPDQAASFGAHLDSPGRLVLEVVPEKRVGFDAAKMWRAAPSAGPAVKVGEAPDLAAADVHQTVT
jgi:hypothetical protein